MIKPKPRDIGPNDLINEDIKNNLEELRSGVMRIILAQDGYKSQKEICGTLNSFIRDWVWGLGVPRLITDGKSDFYESDNEYLISLLIDSTDLLLLDEPGYEDKRVNYSYRIGKSELRQHKLEQLI